MIGWLISSGGALEIFLLYYFLVLNGVYFLLSLVAFGEVYGHLKRTIYGGYERLSRSPLTPPISIIIPAHNEAVGIALTVNNLLHLDYMRYEVIVINDGSTDATLEELQKNFHLSPAPDDVPGPLKTRAVRAVYHSNVHHNLTVIDKERGGKSDALNAGLNIARNPYFCSIDADAILEPDALQRVIQPIMESPIPVIAVGGIIRVANGCRVEKGRIAQVDLSGNPLVIFQVIEYFRAFLCGRTGFSHFNALMIISGAFGLFERERIISIGGYRTDTVGEDIDLVTRLHIEMMERGDFNYRIQFVPDPVCWTEVPSSLKVLSRQRRRWQKGLLEVLARNKKLFFNPRFRTLGLFTYPFLFVFEGWGTAIECFGYGLFLVNWLRGAIDTDFVLGFLFVSFLAGTALSLAGILIGDMTPRGYPRYSHWLALILFAFLENLGYRQLTTFLRISGMLEFMAHRGAWGKMERSGLSVQKL